MNLDSKETMKKNICRWLACACSIALVSPGLAEVSNNQSLANLDELKEYLDSRGFIETRRKGGALKLAGDVRARWINVQLDLKHPDNLQGQTLSLPDKRYRSEYNLYIDYQAEKNWMTSHMNWVAVAGGESSAAGLDIKRAFLGYRFYKDSETQSELFAEIGRSSLGSIFESDIQFDSNFDGLHLYASRRFSREHPYKLIVHGGPFVVNMRYKHYAWCAETILSNLPKNFVAKGSVVDWHSFAPSEIENSSDVSPKYKYCVWQGLVGKHSSMPWWKNQKKNLYVYGGYLFNSLAKPEYLVINSDPDKGIVLDSRENQAWFVGMTLGGLRKAKDWSATLRYEYVEELAIPASDVSGIGRGNSLLERWLKQHDANPSAATFKIAKGFTNYKGVSLLYMYSVTDSLSLRAAGAFSNPANTQLGGDFSHRKIDVGLISAF